MTIKKIAKKNEVHPYSTNLIENTNERGCEIKTITIKSMAIKKIAPKNEVHPYNTNLIENTNER